MKTTEWRSRPIVAADLDFRSSIRVSLNRRPLGLKKRSAGASGRARRYTHLSCVGLSHGRGGITRSFIIGRGRPHQSTNLCWHKGVGVNEVQGSDEFLNAMGQGRLTGQGRVNGYLPSS